MSVAAASGNIARRFAAMATWIPNQAALVTPRGKTSYAELSKLVDRYAHGLAKAGIARGMRTVMMVPAGEDFFALVFALFKLGAVPVFIDPSMGFKPMGKAIADSEAQAFIGIPKAHVARLLGRWGRKTLRRHVTVGGRFGGQPLAELATSDAPFEAADTGRDDVAAILFTSGSTGAPKGVLHTHGSFDVQTDFVRDQFGVAPGEVHVATFPIFALFDLALGATAVLPPGDVTRPAKIDPKVVIDAVETSNATCMFGSPAVLDNLGRSWGRHGSGDEPRMTSLKAIISASGPVLPGVLDRLDRMVSPDTTVYVPYGATEGLPISLIGHRDALQLAARWAAGEGLCIGRPLDAVELAIIGITDDAIASWREAWQLAPGVVGEIVVKGPIISRAYLDAEANRKAKIYDEHGQVWHRMGDLGRVDAEGRLWFFGRKNHRVETPDATLYTIACEAIFLQHPHVQRAALVGVGERGAQQPVMCIETAPVRLRGGPKALEEELLAWAERHAQTAEIETILFYPGSFPMDIRHNSKIFREELARWAARQVK